MYYIWQAIRHENFRLENAVSLWPMLMRKLRWSLQKYTCYDSASLLCIIRWKKKIIAFKYNNILKRWPDVQPSGSSPCCTPVVRGLLCREEESNNRAHVSTITKGFKFFTGCSEQFWYVQTCRASRISPVGVTAPAGTRRSKPSFWRFELYRSWICVFEKMNHFTYQFIFTSRKWPHLRDRDVYTNQEHAYVVWLNRHGGYTIEKQMLLKELYMREGTTPFMYIHAFQISDS